MLSRTRLALVVVVGLTTAAHAGDVQIGAISVKFDPPAGYCDMSDSQPSDARIINALKSGLKGINTVLAFSADCKELMDWRSGARRTLDHYAQAQTMTSSIDKPLPMEPGPLMRALCTQAREEGAKISADVEPDVKKRMAKVLPSIKINAARYIGVIGEDPLACYTASVQKLQTEDGDEKVQVNLTGFTVIKGKLLYYYLYAPYIDVDTPAQMLMQHRANVAKLQAANP